MSEENVFKIIYKSKYIIKSAFRRNYSNNPQYLAGKLLQLISSRTWRQARIHDYNPSACTERIRWWSLQFFT